MKYLKTYEGIWSKITTTRSSVSFSKGRSLIEDTIRSIKIDGVDSINLIENHTNTNPENNEIDEEWFEYKLKLKDDIKKKECGDLLEDINIFLSFQNENKKEMCVRFYGKVEFKFNEELPKSLHIRLPKMSNNFYEMSDNNSELFREGTKTIVVSKDDRNGSYIESNNDIIKYVTEIVNTLKIVIDSFKKSILKGKSDQESRKSFESKTQSIKECLFDLVDMSKENKMEIKVNSLICNFTIPGIEICEDHLMMNDIALKIFDYLSEITPRIKDIDPNITIATNFETNLFTIAFTPKGVKPSFGYVKKLSRR